MAKTILIRIGDRVYPRVSHYSVNRVWNGVEANKGYIDTLSFTCGMNDGDLVVPTKVLTNEHFTIEESE